MSSVYLQTWRCTHCDVTWGRDGALGPCWYCGSDRYVYPSVDECVQGGVLAEELTPAQPMRIPDAGCRGLPANLVIVDEVHEWPSEVLDRVARAPGGHG